VSIPADEILFTVIDDLFSDIASVAGNAKGGNKGKQSNNEHEVCSPSYRLPLFHEHSHNIAEENEHRHMQHPAGKLEVTHFHMSQPVKEELKAPECSGKSRP
jgi:hypothetical protein